MKSTYRSREAVALPLLSLIALLAISNLVANVLAPDWAYVPSNLAVSAVLLWVAVQYVSWAEIGFQRWRRGLAWGGALAGGTLALYAAAVAVPAIRDAFDDERVHEAAHLMVYHTVVRIPAGTVLLEELAFRGVLPAMFLLVLRGRWRTVRACALASALFGLWHVLPAMNLTNVNEGLRDLLGTGAPAQVVAIVGAVGGTFVAGMWFCALRYWSGSIAVPILAHIASNSFAYAIAWSVS